MTKGLIFVFMYFRMHPYIINSKVNNDFLFSLHNKGIDLVVYVLV